MTCHYRQNDQICHFSARQQDLKSPWRGGKAGCWIVILPTTNDQCSYTPVYVSQVSKQLLFSVKEKHLDVEERTNQCIFPTCNNNSNTFIDHNYWTTRSTNPRFRYVVRIYLKLLIKIWTQSSWYLQKYGLKTCKISSAKMWVNTRAMKMVRNFKNANRILEYNLQI